MKNFILLPVLLAAMAILASCEEKSNIIELTVASERADCMQVDITSCYIVKYDPEDDWSYFYDHIEGFDYEPGHEYVIRVKTRQIENPPADGSSISYTLDKVLSKTRKDSQDLPRSMTAIPQTEIMTVASELRDCVGVGPRKCMLIKREANDNWEFFYAHIEGFEYEEGYEYVIKVAKEPVEEYIADAPGIEYTLVGIISVEQKDSEDLPENRTL